MHIPANKADLQRILWKASLDFGGPLSAETAQMLADGIEDLADAVFLHNEEATDGDAWKIHLTHARAPDEAAIRARLSELGHPLTDNGFYLEQLPQTDWLLQVHRDFPPIISGRFFIYGSHITDTPPVDKIPLQIDAATAFGSGEHETTRGCLEALESLHAQNKTFQNVLDMGCGSGILAIAALKLYPDAHATAIDIDPESARVTARHSEMNGVEKHMIIAAGDGYQAKEAHDKKPYDLVFANILAGPLIAMAPDLFAHLAPNGYAILSGLLARQEEDVKKAHIEAGLVFVSAIAINDWRALLFRKEK